MKKNGLTFFRSSLNSVYYIFTAAFSTNLLTVLPGAQGIKGRFPS